VSNAHSDHTTALEWTDLDRRTVDTVRALAMDAVEKTGNGHPGTAMSLAPAAYLLFQKVMKHNPADPGWTGRDRFVLSAGHSSLTLYIQLYLAGYELWLDDLKSLRTWGSKTPGHPEYGHTMGVETTTGPLGQGVGNAVGMAMAARRERGLYDPESPTGQSLFDHHVFAFASDGDMQEGVAAEASSLAAHQKLGNLVLLYDDNDISIEDNTDIAFSEDVAARYEAYGWHVQRVDWTQGGRGYEEDVQALWEAFQTARAETSRPSFIALRTIIAWPAPNARNTGKAHGSALGADEVAATKRLLGFDPEQTFQVPDGVLAHTRQALARGAEMQQQWQQQLAEWAEAHPRRRELLERLRDRRLPDGWADVLPSFDADDKGVATRKASGAVLGALAPELPELWGGSADRDHLSGRRVTGDAQRGADWRRDRWRRGARRARTGAARAVGWLGRPRRLQQHDAEGPAVLRPARARDQGVPGRLVRPGPALRDPRARDGCPAQRDGAARQHPAVRRDVPDLQRLHAAGRAAGGADAAAGDLRVDP